MRPRAPPDAAGHLPPRPRPSSAAGRQWPFARGSGTIPVRARAISPAPRRQIPHKRFRTLAKTPRTWTGARTPSGLKRVRTSARRHEILGPRRTVAKTLVKTALAAATSSTEGVDAMAALTDAISALDRAAKVGAIHPNAAARRKSRLVRKVNAAVGGTAAVSSRVAKTIGKTAALKAAKARIAAGKAGKAKGAQTAAGKARAALSKSSRAEAAAAASAAAAKAAAAAAVVAPKAKGAAKKAAKAAAPKKAAVKATVTPAADKKAPAKKAAAKKAPAKKASKA
ncbi:MAG: 30S ribosomal protein S20 [Chloroflexota bacterium]